MLQDQKVNAYATLFVGDTAPASLDAPATTAQLAGNLASAAVVEQHPARPPSSDHEKIGMLRENFERLRPSMHALVAELAPSIREGRWSSLLVEGHRAQLPGLILSRLLSE